MDNGLTMPQFVNVSLHCLIKAIYFFPLTAISCERLNNPDNGIVIVNGNTNGAVATYRCNPGFQLVGSEQRICQEDRTYNGVTPFCRGIFTEHIKHHGLVFIFLVVIDCGPLGNPENGIVKFGGTIIGSIATYACNKGFTLIGDSNRICQPSGDWSGQEPTCSSKSNCTEVSDTLFFL